MNKAKGGVEITDAEIVDDIQAIEDNFDDLPPRSDDKGTWKARNEHRAIKNTTTREESRIRRNMARKIMRSWLKRAKLANVDPLPARRPTPGQRKAWEKKIIAAEKKAS